MSNNEKVVYYLLTTEQRYKEEKYGNIIELYFKYSGPSISMLEYYCLW